MTGISYEPKDGRVYITATSETLGYLEPELPQDGWMEIITQRLTTEGDDFYNAYFAWRGKHYEDEEV